MIFKSIKLENFRQYKNVQVDFSDKINIIEAGNGVGKSTLMAALIFAMFGYEKAKNSGFIEVTEVTPLINLDCLEENTYQVIDDKQQVKVSFTLKTNDGSEYNIIRSYKPFDNSESLEVKKSSKDNNYYVEDISFEEINSIIPSEFIPLLFFDGERIKKIEDSISKASSEFKAEIEKILKISELNDAKKLIRSSAKKLSEETHFENPRIKELSEEIQKAEALIERNREKIESNEIKLNDLELKKNTLNLMLQEIDEVKETAKKIQELDLKIKTLNEKSSESEMKAREQIFNNFPDIVRLNIYEKLLESMSISVSDYKISGIEQSAIDSILENGKCICNTPLDGEKIYALEELRKVLPPESFQTILSVKLDNKEDEIERLRNNVKDYSKISSDVNDELSSLKNMRQTLKEKMRYNYSSDEINTLVEESEHIDSLMDKIKLDIHDDNKNNIRFEEFVSRKKTEYDSELKKENKKDVERKVIAELQIAEETIKDHISSRKMNLKELLEKRVNNYANELLSEGIKIELDANLRPKKIKLDNRSESLSTGQGVIVSISYLFALMETSKEETDYGYHMSLTEDYPIVFDGVTATLDDYHTRRIIDYIEKIDSQFIIFANTKEVKLFNEQLNGKFKKFFLNKPKDSNALSVEE